MSVNKSWWQERHFVQESTKDFLCVVLLNIEQEGGLCRRPLTIDLLYSAQASIFSFLRYSAMNTIHATLRE